VGPIYQTSHLIWEPEENPFPGNCPGTLRCIPHQVLVEESVTAQGTLDLSLDQAHALAPVCLLVDRLYNFPKGFKTRENNIQGGKPRRRAAQQNSIVREGPGSAKCTLEGSPDMYARGSQGYGPSRNKAYEAPSRAPEGPPPAMND
jgi:hypothetical protein